MKVSKIVVIFLLILLASGFSFSVAPEKFWVCFGAPRPDSPLRSGNYLMQIDVLGNVLLSPFRVAKTGAPRSGGARALSLNGSSALNLWLNPVEIFRFVVGQRTLKTIRFVQTKLKPIDGSLLTVTHKGKNNFLSFSVSTVDGIRVAAYPVDQFGRITGKRWFLSPALSSICDVARCIGGVAPNGRVAFWTDINPKNSGEGNLFIRPLGNLGRPIRDPVLIDRIQSLVAFVSTFRDADVSDVVEGNKRYVVYMKAPTPTEGIPQSLKLQKVDAVTGKKLGRSIVLYKADELGTNVKIDPRGRFVIFTGGSLSYLALDATGHASGKPKVLVPTPQLGAVDLLQENRK